jgi:predicted neuraminidase
VSRRCYLHLTVILLLLQISGCNIENRKNNENTLNSSGIVQSEFIFEKAPFAQCHASTIAETEYGLVTAWFGGTRESRPDVGIWLSRHGPNGWSPVEKVADGSELSDRQVACWNPVLFQPKSGPLMLFYKVGDDEPEWWGEYKTSSDGGKTWSKPTRLPDGILGPIKNKPIQLPNASILSPSSIEYYVGRNPRKEMWQVHLEMSDDMGKTWQKIGPLNDGKNFNVIQPSILIYPNRKMQILCRSERAGRIYQAWSDDMGRTWSKMTAGNGTPPLCWKTRKGNILIRRSFKLPTVWFISHTHGNGSE